MFKISYYKGLKIYLQFAGICPYKSHEFKDITVIIVMFGIASILIPTLLELCMSIRNKNMDGALECVPHLNAAAACLVKLVNIHFHRHNFNKLYQYVIKEWNELKLSNELYVLDEITLEGNKMAHLYRNTLLSFMIFFLLVPLVSPILDVIQPLNETRPRQQLLRVNYIFFNYEDYFFYVYFQLAVGSIIVVVCVIAADWLYILIIHHSGGLFAVCGHQVQKATKNSLLHDNGDTLKSYSYKQFKQCAIMHKEAIQFYTILNESSQVNYLIQVGINMIGISVTAVQTVINLNKPAEALRCAVFCGANQFHLFVLSLPGQVLLDHCSNLTNTIYSSTWYKTPVRIQKIIYMMQIRCQKLCTLTAGGLYEMNMENFGTTFKTCMSYFTIILSLRK